MVVSDPRRGYSPGMTVGAALVTLFFPLIALIIALVLRGNESEPEKRSFLKQWAVWSAVWLVVPLILILLATTRMF